MIYYIYKSPNWYTVEKHFLTSWAPELRARLKLVSYDALFRRRRAPRGAYIFSDIDRLTPAERERAGAIRRRLLEADPALKCLNDPLASLNRYALLRRLHSEGLNLFNVYRLDERAEPARYPVFIRSEHEHDGPVTDLLNSRAALDAAIADLRARGASLDDKIITEFIDVADGDGAFHKYGDFYVGGRIIPQHVFFAGDWRVKFNDGLAVRPDHVEFEATALRQQPHAADVEDVFKRANIDYGRIDYAVADGRIQTFEINTNPHILPDLKTKLALAGPRGPGRARFAAELAAAFAAIDVVSEGAPIALDAIAQPRRTVHPRWRDGFNDILRRTGLSPRAAALRAAVASARGSAVDE